VDRPRLLAVPVLLVAIVASPAIVLAQATASPAAAEPSASPDASSRALVAASPSPAVSAPPGGTLLTIATTLEEPGLFDRDTLEAAAGAEVTVRYDNQVPLQHNIAFFAGDSMDAPVIARTIVASGPGIQEVTFATPAEPAALLFVCEVHWAAMRGVLTTR
jgi:plastocyanin